MLTAYADQLLQMTEGQKIIAARATKQYAGGKEFLAEMLGEFMLNRITSNI